eukprot:SAG31_NODE_785_length_12089_cov_4.342936_2_plen_106_part_00
MAKRLYVLPRRSLSRQALTVTMHTIHRAGDLEQLKSLHKSTDASSRIELLEFMGPSGLSALHWVSSKEKPEHLRCIKWLVRNAGCRVDVQGKDGKTPLVSHASSV